MLLSDSEIPIGVWLERFGFVVILITLIAFLPIARGYKILASVILLILAYASAQVHGGTIF